jgi:hypothetical protein
MTITMTLKESVSEVEEMVSAAIAQQANTIFQKGIGKLVNDVRSLIVGWIESQPEMKSLDSRSIGSLAGLFGISGDPAAIISAISNSVANAVEVEFKPFNSKLTSGGLELRLQPSNFSNLLGLSAGKVDIEGGELHWLSWLLTAGDTIVVANYSYNPTTGLGRSGLGNMRGGGSFRVPPQFSGIDSNNFVTRALIGPTQERELTNLFERMLR